MKRLFFAIAIALIGLTAFTADPPGTKVPIGLIVGAGKTKTVIDSTELKRIKEIDNKVSLDSLQSATDQFYTKTQSNARFINEDGDTITGTILVPTPAVGTNTTQVVNAAFVNQNVVKRLFPVSDVSSGLPITNTASTTTENTVLTIPIPGNTIGSNGTLSCQALWDVTSNTNQKYIRIYIDAVNASNLIATFNNNAVAGFQAKFESFLWNINGTQYIQYPIQYTSGAWNSMTSAGTVNSRSFDFTQSHNLIVTLQTSVSTDALVLKGFSVFTTY